MPRTGGVYSPPAGTKGTPNTTIQSVPYNTWVDDLTADANAARPVTAGGTGATTASGARTALGLEIGTNVQAYDADLTAIAALVSAANKLPYATGSGTWALSDFTPYGRTLVATADAAAGRSALGLGTAATQNTGTSGANVPLLNAANTWSAAQDFNVAPLLSAAQADGAQCLVFATERSWTVRQRGAGASANLSFENTSNKAIEFSSDLTYAGSKITLVPFGPTPSILVGSNAVFHEGSTIAVTNGGTGSANAAGARTNLGAAARTTTITAGLGLTGGGDLSANRTITLSLGGIPLTSSLGIPRAVVVDNTDGLEYRMAAADFRTAFGVAGYSTATSNAETNFPIGHTVSALNSVGVNRNDSATVRLYTSNAVEYTTSGAGAVLAGTYRGRGLTSADRQLFERMA